MRVLFVCTANICRSAYADVVSRHIAGAGSQLEIRSAGTYGLDGLPLNEEMAEWLPGGISATGFASRRVAMSDVRSADLVLAMDAGHRKYLLEEFPSAFRRLFLLGQFAEAVELIHRSELGDGQVWGLDLVAEIARRRPPARREHDVADPYRNGPAANERVAAQILGYLAVVLPALGERP